ncbi:hypothetical protein CFL1_01572 [Lactobacillus delbrueckii subsp. bulgaricus]|nr:hypothetical protein CFL1_01572 [Lactobacillus delbrueckii subsp. bulgaricus]
MTVMRRFVKLLPIKAVMKIWIYWFTIQIGKFVPSLLNVDAIKI